MEGASEVGAKRKILWNFYDINFIATATAVDRTQQRLAQLEASEETVAKETLQV